MDPGKVQPSSIVVRFRRREGVSWIVPETVLSQQEIGHSFLLRLFQQFASYSISKKPFRTSFLNFLPSHLGRLENTLISWLFLKSRSDRKYLLSQLYLQNFLFARPSPMIPYATEKHLTRLKLKLIKCSINREYHSANVIVKYNINTNLFIYFYSFRDELDCKNFFCS